MRPLRLTIDGFRSYASQETFDFAERRLIGVVGPIGSGKSSLLDAISFALYGKTPTVERDTKGLINQRLDQAKVDLWFEAGGQIWRAVRALRRKGQGAATLTRHNAVDDDRLEEVIGVRDVSERVTLLLGLDFGAFTRSVLLAQNQFAEFLHATPKNRNDVLRGVFGFDKVERMHDVAKSKRDEAGRDLEELERRRKEIESDKAKLEQTEAELKEARARQSALADRSDLVTELQDEVAAGASAEKACADRLAELSAIADRFPVPEATDRLLSDADTDARDRQAADAAATAAAAAVAEAEQLLAGVVESYGDRDALLAAEQAAAAATAAREASGAVKTRLDKANAEVESATAAVTAAADKEQAAAARRDEAAGGLETAQSARDAALVDLHAAQHAEMAHTVRSTLVVGDACPVCEQPVAKIPKTKIPAGVKAAQKAADAAERVASKAAAALDGATAALAGAGSQRAATEASSAAAEAKAAELEAEWDIAQARASELEDVARALAGDEDLARYLEQWKPALDAATAKVGEAADAEKKARARAEEARLASEARVIELQRLASEIAGLSGRLDLDLEPAADPASLGDALTSIREAWQREEAAAEDEAKAAAKKREEAAGRLGDVLKEFDVATAADFAAALQKEHSHVAGLESRAQLLEEQVARVAQLEAENAKTVARHGLFTRLSVDLAPTKFLSYLLDEERTTLSHLGSDQFEQLSAERYRFSDDGTFAIVDLAAAERERSTDSLSGGETFLASLALALALAEMVSRKGGRLDAFMLDEGFGSLDPEHLDLAMQGIERLVSDSSQRLVLVVSHVPELKERLDDLIVLDKDPVTGNTVVR